jgi:hypothetical protein
MYRPVLLSVAAGSLIVFGISSPNTSTAEVIANYDFSSSPTPSQIDSTDTQLQSVASDFNNAYDSGTGFSSVGGGSFFVRADDVVGNATTPGTESAAITEDEYVSFTITPIAGYEIDYQTLSFDILMDRSSSGDPAPFATWFLKTSVGGFGASDPTVGSRNAPVSSVDTDLATITPLIDLSALGTRSDTVEFRIYTFDNEISSTVPHRLDNVIVNGDVSLIPEPATVALVSLGLFCCTGRRQRSD